MFDNSLITIIIAVTSSFIVIFIILLIASIISFKGGNFINRTKLRFLFTKNYICDLGRKYTFTRELNTPTQILFQAGVTIGAIALIGIYIFFLIAFVIITTENKMGLAASAIGLLATIFCIIWAYIPVDQKPKLHRGFVYAFCNSQLLANIILVIALFRIPTYPLVWGIIFVISDTLLAIYFIINLAIKPRSPEKKELIKVITQKFISVIYFSNVIIQMFVFGIVM
ncbi:MAG: hypothetical protein FK734_10820 [Asgard group archaeon]|nr:hypothetical protein [Asgard group archaeon]